MRIKNTAENMDWILLKMADQSYLIKIFLIVHHKYSQADIANYTVNRSKAEQRTRTNLSHSDKLKAQRKHPIDCLRVSHLFVWIR